MQLFTSAASRVQGAAPSPRRKGGAGNRLWADDAACCVRAAPSPGRACSLPSSWSRSLRSCRSLIIPTQDLAGVLVYVPVTVTFLWSSEKQKAKVPSTRKDVCATGPSPLWPLRIHLRCHVTSWPYHPSLTRHSRRCSTLILLFSWYLSDS